MRIGQVINGIGTVESIDESGPFGPIATCVCGNELVGATQLPDAVGASKSARSMLAASQNIANDLLVASRTHNLPLERRLDFVWAEDSAWLRFRPLAGHSLEALPVVPADIETANWLEPIALALDFCHQRGVAHGDVRPFNIWILPDQTPALLDVGMTLALTEVLKRLTGSDILGTLPYRAPEHISGGASGAGDIYSLGVCAYRHSTGVLPFAGGSLLRSIRTRPLPQSDHLKPSTFRVLESATAKLPDDRPASATAFVGELRRSLTVTILSGPPGESESSTASRPADPPSSSGVFRRLIVRPHAPAALAMTVVAASVSTMLFAGYAVARADRAADRYEQLVDDAARAARTLETRLASLTQSDPSIADSSSASKHIQSASLAIDELNASLYAAEGRESIQNNLDHAAALVQDAERAIDLILSTGLRLTTSTRDVRVSVGSETDIVPPVTYRTEPGRYSVIATAPGHKPTRTEVEVVQGSIVEIDLGSLEKGRQEGRAKGTANSGLSLDLGRNDGLRVGSSVRIRFESAPIRGPNGEVLGYDEIDAEVIEVKDSTSVAVPLVPLGSRALRDEPFTVIAP